jgi:hypothetical protein
MRRECVGDISALQLEERSLTVRQDDLIRRVAQSVFIQRIKLNAVFTLTALIVSAKWSREAET